MAEPTPEKKIRAKSRPVKGVRMHLHVEPYHVEWIDREARARGLSRTLFMREILDQLIAQNPPDRA